MIGSLLSFFFAEWFEAFIGRLRELSDSLRFMG